MPDRNPPLAESILARTVGPSRAAGIYGDLLELAAARGRLWFWAALLRTLIGLSWRAPFAFACGLLVTLGVMGSIFRFWRHLTPDYLRLIPSWFHLALPLLASTAVPLWFLLTYVSIRYGRHDRLVRLTAVLTVTMTFAFLYAPWISACCGVSGILIAACAILHPLWRRPMFVLSAAIATGYLGMACANAMRVAIPILTHFERSIPVLIFRLTLAAVLAVEAYVCAKSYRALIRTDLEHRGLPGA